MVFLYKKNVYGTFFSTHKEANIIRRIEVIKQNLFVLRETFKKA